MTTKKNSSKTPAQPALPTASAAKSGMTVSVETHTPESAAEILSRNTRNRTPNERHAAALAAAMLAGLWQFSPQTISIGEDGSLIDGQHRLMALVRAGMTLQFVVARNVPCRTRDVVDTSVLPRSARHALQIADGVTISTVESAAFSAMFALKTRGRLDGASQAVNTNALRSTRSEHGADVRAVIAVMCEGGRMRHAGVVAALAFARRAHPEKVDEFCRHLRDLAGLEKDHPAITLRSYAFEHRGAGGGAHREEVNLKAFAAFEAFREGRTLKKLYERPDVRAKYLAPWRSETTAAT